MQYNVSGSARRVLTASILLACAGLLTLASSAQEPAYQRPTPPSTYVPTAPAGPLARLTQQYRYRGGHPVHPDFGQGWCDEAGSHTHPYAPFEPELFCASNGEFVFIGDPADFQFDGPVYWYANPHPLDDEHGGDWCHYPWPHRHTFALSGAMFNLVGGLLYFIGDFTQAFFKVFEHKRRFFRRHYRRRYLRGRVYQGGPRRYVRVGPGQYRLLHPRAPRFQPYRPPLTRRPDRLGGLSPRPGRSPHGLTRRPDRSPHGLTRRPDRSPHGLTRRPDRPLPLTVHRRIDRGRGVVVQDPRPFHGLRRLPRVPRGEGQQWSRRVRGSRFGRRFGRRGGRRFGRRFGRRGGRRFGRRGGRRGGRRFGRRGGGRAFRFGGRRSSGGSRGSYRTGRSGRSSSSRSSSGRSSSGRSSSSRRR